MKKSKFEKAASQYGKLTAKNTRLALKAKNGLPYTFGFVDKGDYIQVTSNFIGDYKFPVTEDTTVGDLCKLIADHIETHNTNANRKPPEKLTGTGPGGFEELLMQSAERLEKKGILTMGRYPVASVMMKGQKFPLQVPSLPDFEGVWADGSQFIIEAKVCSQSAFPIDKAHIKPRQVKHMLKRNRFNVPGWVMIHFNARLGKTFYDPPLTVALRVLPEDQGGHPFWEKLAITKKGEYVGSLSREEAREHPSSTEIRWRVPSHCRKLRPDLEYFMYPEK